MGPLRISHLPRIARGIRVTALGKYSALTRRSADRLAFARRDNGFSVSPRISAGIGLPRITGCAGLALRDTATTPGPSS
jgi:hypothetical protein